MYKVHVHLIVIKLCGKKKTRGKNSKTNYIDGVMDGINLKSRICRDETIQSQHTIPPVRKDVVRKTSTGKFMTWKEPEEEYVVHHQSEEQSEESEDDEDRITYMVQNQILKFCDIQLQVKVVTDMCDFLLILIDVLRFIL